MKMTDGFRKRLAKRQEKIGSLVCIGLDPLPEKIPSCIKTNPFYPEKDFYPWMKEIIDATAHYASMFKPQKAHWEAFASGDTYLHWTINYIKKNYPDIPIFLDCKRGDIGRTQEHYREGCFRLNADGMNFSPYMGRDCMEYLIDKNHLERAIVGLCYTSNPSAREIQDALMKDGRPLWEFIAEKTLGWAKTLGIVENAGLVMAAAYERPKGLGIIYSEHLTRCREIVGNDLWFLIPGIGTQGGFIAETVRAAFTGYGSIAINSSSEISFASSSEDFAEAAGRKAKELRDEIASAL